MLTPLLMDQDSRYGRLVVVKLPDPEDEQAVEQLKSVLLESERKMLASYGPRRVVTFAGGRYALRHALEREGIAFDGPILPNARGAPELRGQARVSIAHKDEAACAFVAYEQDAHYGVDIEVLKPVSEGVAQRIMTEAELETWSALEGDERDRFALLTFAVKEALYKALDPYVQRYVHFWEVELELQSQGELTIKLALEEGPATHRADGYWLEQDDMLIAVTRARPFV